MLEELVVVVVVPLPYGLVKEVEVVVEEPPVG